MHLRLLVLAGIFVAAFGLSAQASCLPVLLTVDLSDPSNVTITATGNFASENSSATLEGDGIDLLQFFTFSTPADPVEVSSLTPSGGPGPYNAWETDDYSLTNIYNDFNVFASNEFASSTQSFTTDSVAFTGYYTGIDLSAFEGSLPEIGAGGDILAGYTENSDGVIGEWVVVPEPSQYGFLVFLAVAGFVGVKRFSPRLTRP